MYSKAMLLLALAPILFGQTPSASAAPQPPVPVATKITAPGFTVVDGSTNPDLIPDATAFRMFLGAFGSAAPAQSTNPAASAALLTPNAHQAAKLRQMNMSAADNSTFLAAVTTWQQQIHPAAGTAPLIAGALDAAVGPFMTALQRGLTPAGWTSQYGCDVRSKRGQMKILTGQPHAH